MEAIKPGDTHETSLLQTAPRQPQRPTSLASAVPILILLPAIPLSQVLLQDQGQGISLSISSFFPPVPPTLASTLSTLQAHHYLYIYGFIASKCQTHSSLLFSEILELNPGSHFSFAGGRRVRPDECVWGGEGGLGGDCKRKGLIFLVPVFFFLKSLCVDSSLPTHRSLASDVWEIQ